MTDPLPAPLPAETPSPAPIWAPNPAVPLPARIMAYLFGGITLLTALLGLLVQRPPDVPPMPAQWSVCHTSLGCSLPYPTGWVVESRHGKKDEETVVTLMSGSPVHIECYAMQLEMPANASIIGELERLLEPDLRKRFKHYSPRDDGLISASAEREQAFTFDLSDDNDTKMTGVWLMRSYGRNILFLVAITPLDGMTTMEQIADHMLANAAFE